MKQCVLVHLLKYSIKTIPNDLEITDLLDLLVCIEDQAVFLHTTQIMLIYTEIFPVCIYVQNYWYPIATLKALHTSDELVTVC